MLALLALGGVIALQGLQPQPVTVDASTPGTVYAVGTNWKARLDAGGARFTPFLGADAERSETVLLEPARVTVGGVLLASSSEAAAECTGHVVRYARGGFDEVYEARPEGLEHLLVFDALPARGEIVVRASLASSLPARQARDAVEFANERGGVRYPGALAFDAEGSRLELASRLDGASIVLTVPAEFAARAVLPLTIDPLIHVFGVATVPSFDFAADTAFQLASPAGEYRCEVFETAWSASDHDITARVTPVQGGVAPTFLIDATTEYWSQAKVASVYDSKLSSRFLVVAAAGSPSGGARAIRGREIKLMFSGMTLGAVTPVGSAVGDNHHPDVGGDPFSDAGGTGSYFAVVYQSDKPDGDTDLHGGNYPAAAIPIAVDPLTDDENPRISKANGVFQWCFVWQRRTAPGNSDIWASTLAYGAGTASAPALVSNAPEDESNPSVSSPCQGGFLIAYERDMGGQRDVFVQSFLASAGPALNLTQLEGGTHQALDQRWPVVDGDYSGLLLSYRDDDPVDPMLVRTRLTSLEVTLANLVVLHEIRRTVGNPGISRNAANVSSHAAAFLTSPPIDRFVVVWDEIAAPGQSDAYGAVFVDGATSGTVTPACYGDGSITACPCGSNGGAPAGCPNSAQATGGELQWTGVADVSADTFVVHAYRLTPNAPVVLAGGSAFNGSGIPYGDGLLCLGGSLVRLVYLVTSPTGTLTYPALVTDPSISTLGGIPPGGGTQNYQFVFRDAVSFCTPGTFNTSNALRVNWTP